MIELSQLYVFIIISSRIITIIIILILITIMKANIV